MSVSTDLLTQCGKDLGSSLFALGHGFLCLSPPFRVRHGRQPTSLFVLSKLAFLCGPKLFRVRSVAGKSTLKTHCAFLWLPEVYLEEGKAGFLQDMNFTVRFWS